MEVRRLVERELPGPGYVAVTNDEFSTVARHAGLVLPLHAGDEAAISTKTYTNTLALLLLMAGALESDAELDELFDLMGCVSGALLPENGDALAELAEFLLPGDAIAFVGRGPAFVTARQSALTFMEGARCLTSAFTGGDFRHGPFEAVGPDFRMVVFAPGGWTTTYSEALAREAASLGARVVLVTDHSLPEQDNLRVLRIANIAGPDAESLFPLIASGVMPVLLYHLARARGTEAGEFRYGGKITTRE